MTTSAELHEKCRPHDFGPKGDEPRCLKCGMSKTKAEGREKARK